MLQTVSVWHTARMPLISRPLTLTNDITTINQLRPLQPAIASAHFSDSPDRVTRDTEHKRKSDEQRLFEKLLSNYDTAARPVYDSSQTVLVRFGLTLAQLVDMVGLLFDF